MGGDADGRDERGEDGQTGGADTHGAGGRRYRLPADVVLATRPRGRVGPVYQAAAVEAGQVIGWAQMPFTYAQYAAWLKSVNTGLTAAKVVTD